MDSRNSPGFLGMQPLCLPPPTLVFPSPLQILLAGCCRASLVQEVAIQVTFHSHFILHCRAKEWVGFGCLFFGYFFFFEGGWGRGSGTQGDG